MLALVYIALAQEETWLTPDGVTGYAWGTGDVPLDAVPRPRDLVLPDSAYIGASKQDRPDDLELKAPQGERHFVRYAHGVLVDAWVVSNRTLDPGPLVAYEKPEWTGTILGPAEGGYLAYGTASSWTVGDRTVLRWTDRAGKLDILASRAVPTLQYGIGRPRPLALPGDTHAKATLKGDLKKAARPYAANLAGCFDTSPKPVEAQIDLRFDGRGQPSRIRISADQPAFELEECVASALVDVRGTPNGEGSLSMRRFR